MRTSLIPLPDASHSRTKVLVKSGRASTGVVHIASFKAWKDWFVVGVQLKALFLRRVVRGPQFFHNFEQTCDNIPLNPGNHADF
jgi:hypothetical protein